MSTLTVYPDPSSGSTTCDGYVTREGVDQTFSNIRSGAGNGAYTNNSFCRAGYLEGSTTSNQYTEMDRLLFTLDTSALTAGATGVSGVFSLDGSTVGLKQHALGDPDFHVAGATPASNNTLANADYGQCQTTSFGSVSYASASTTGYSNITLNASGNSAISLTGITKFSVQSSWDINNSTTGLTWASGGQAGWYVTMADTAGTSTDPKLVVTYTVTVAPTVTTQAATNVTKNSFTGNGNITATGGANATRRGFCYKVGTSGDPTVADSIVYDDGDFGTGAFSENIDSI